MEGGIRVNKIADHLPYETPYKNDKGRRTSSQVKISLTPLPLLLETGQLTPPVSENNLVTISV